MKNSEFMREAVAGRLAKPRGKWARECSNVLYDGEHVYSYGGHYPLLIQLQTANGPRWILNDRGYSSSTGRHISHARPLADAAVSMPRGGSTYPDDIKKAALAGIETQHEYIDESRAKIAKRPKYAHVYEAAIQRASDRIRNLERAIAICEAAEEFATLNRAASAA